MSSVISKYSAFLVFVVLALVFGVVSGCNDNFTMENSNDSRELNQERQEDCNKIDELWVISSKSDTRNGLTIEQIIEILNANREFYTTADGEIDDELLRRFVLNYFDSVEIIINDDEIEALLKRIEICCRLDPVTKTIKVTIVIKNK